MWLARLTDRPDMTLDVYRGPKTTTTTEARETGFLGLKVVCAHHYEVTQVSEVGSYFPACSTLISYFLCFNGIFHETIYSKALCCDTKS